MTGFRGLRVAAPLKPALVEAERVRALEVSAAFGSRPH